MRVYEEYKKIDLPWLEEIPAHWKVQRAKTMFRKMDRPAEDTDEVITCFRDGEVTLRSNRRTTGFTESLKEIGYQGIRKGDLVIHVMDAFAGAVGVSDSNGKGTPVYSVCTPKGDYNNHYYANIIRIMAKTGYIQSLYRGIRERSSDFRFEVFAEQILPIPPREEQDAIVRFLDAKCAKIDSLIKLKERQIELLNEKKQNVINQAVTKGLDPHAPMKDSGVDWIGEIPEGWEVRKVKQCAQILRGRFNHRPRNDESLYGGNFPFIQTGDVAQAKKFITEFKQTLNEKGYSVSKEFPKDTLVMTIAANIGHVAILKFPSCAPDSIVGFYPNDTNKFFMYYLFLAMKEEILKRTPVNTQGNLNIERIGQMEMPVPQLYIQDKIVSYLEEVDKRYENYIDNIKKQIIILKEYQARIISDVVTGKLAVANN